MLNLLSAILFRVFSILPDSPFSTFSGDLNEPVWLAYMNWFLPFDTCLQILVMWGGLIGAYYTFSNVRKIVDKIFDFFK